MKSALDYQIQSPQISQPQSDASTKAPYEAGQTEEAFGVR